MKILATTMLAAALFAAAPASAESVADKLAHVAQLRELASRLQAGPTAEEIRAAAAVIAMQYCFELNSIVIDHAVPAETEAEARDCIRYMQKLAQ